LYAFFSFRSTIPDIDLRTDADFFTSSYSYLFLAYA
jgi:hypothetical protein